MNQSPQSDIGIPVLTEVLDIPPQAAAAFAPAAEVQASAGAVSAEAAAPQPPAIDEEALLEAMRQSILKDLQERIRPLLDTRLRTALEASIDRMVGEIGATLRWELDRMVEEAVHKEMIRREAARR